MTFPYFIVRNSWPPVFFGKLFSHGPFHAWTLGPWIFFPTDHVEPRVLVHERVHVKQFYLSWAVALVAWAVFRPSWLWLVLTPLAFPWAYVLAGFYAMFRGRDWYHGNPFERAARRVAGEPVE